MRNPGEHTQGGLRHQGRVKKGAPGRPLVSVVTIVFNDEAHIGATMESVVGQTYAPIEYIVIDGGSTDHTLAVIRSYEDRIDHWQSGPDQGVSDAFNKGIRAARGEYIGLINAGDWYEPETVARVVEAFSRNPETGVVCGSLRFWKGEERVNICQSAPRLLERDMTVTHPTCFVRADLYKRFGLYENGYRYAMDYRLLLGLKVQGTVFAALPDVLANMRHCGMSEVHWREALRETHRARRELLPGSLYATGLYYRFVECKRRARMFLEKLGAGGLVGFYRRRLALVKKNGCERL